MKIKNNSVGKYSLTKKLNKWRFLPIEVMVSRSIEKKIIINFDGYNENEVLQFFEKYLIATTMDAFYAIQAQGLDNGTIEKVYFSEVLYFEAVKNKLYFYTESSAFQIKNKLYDVEALYYSFFRIGKSFAVNMNAVQSMKPIENGRLAIVLTDGQKLTVSRRYSSDFKYNFYQRRD